MLELGKKRLEHGVNVARFQLCAEFQFVPINLHGVADGHLAVPESATGLVTTSMRFDRVGEAQLCDGKNGGLQALPDQLAARFEPCEVHTGWIVPVKRRCSSVGRAADS